MTVCVLFLHRFRGTSAKTMIRKYFVKGKEGVTVQSAIYPLLVHEYLIKLCFRVIG